MRLGTCIALELAVVVGAFGGVYVGVGHAIDAAGDYLTTHEAAAATWSGPARTPARLPGATLAITPEVVHQPVRNVFGVPDSVLLAPLGAAPVSRVKLNRGGTSLSLSVEFANGSRGSFKPIQVFRQSEPRREVAAFKIDRLLGIGHVPPAKPIAIRVTDLVAAIDQSARTFTAGRVDKEAIADNGVLRGMMSWWIPEIREATIGGHQMHEAVAQDQLLQYLQVGAQVPDADRNLVEQFATCIVFDVIIDNADRWSGANTKVSPDHRTLYFMDNTMSFSLYTHGREHNLRPLLRMQVYPRGLVKRLREMTLDSLRAALAQSDDSVGLGPLLTEEEMRAVIARRDYVVSLVDRLIARHGEDAVLALP